MLNPTEEAKFAELKALCVKLKVPSPPEIMIGLKVHDKDGVLIFDDLQRGHSWTRNFWNWMFGFSTGCAVTGTTYEAGVLSIFRNIGSQGNGSFSDGYAEATPDPGPVSNSSYGIQVGTDDTAFGTEQCALVAQILQGTGSGQFSHTLETIAAASYAAGTHIWSCNHVRVFNNNSAAAITVKEVGIMVSSAFSGQLFLIERSVLSPTVPVPIGAQLTVTYEISMDFSAID
jgi:hypothetical protein